ncbi:DUF397 domain-containing protein [Streptomyces sp. NPDC059479]|uniref:DUF397 domain-containing protein n=1 Tax=Streptomyces sp. NPDC059479 TaxID=3346848 RepID=UPI0036CD543A
MPDRVITGRWRKSSYSGSENGDCVEVAGVFRGEVPVRDSKNPGGPVLVFPAGGWGAFVVALKRGGLPEA